MYKPAHSPSSRKLALVLLVRWHYARSVVVFGGKWQGYVHLWVEGMRVLSLE